MQIREITDLLESLAPPSLQESYDNCGLIIGDASVVCKGIITTLDVTSDTIDEAMQNNCNLVVAHHPIIFKGLKKINGKDYVEKTVIAAIKNDIAVYAIHTNLDNIIDGVNKEIANRIGLINQEILETKKGFLLKLFTYAPMKHADKVRDALFKAGAGGIGKYSECSFNTGGMGTFKPGEGTDPYLGVQGERHSEEETKIEVILPAWKQQQVIKALKENHPYEEVAYELIALENSHQETGSGLIGELEKRMDESDFLRLLKDKFALKIIRHTALTGKQVKRVALCGGAGSFLVSSALRGKADFFITADMKYHEFFDADGKMVIADIGHFESEQFTIDLLTRFLQEKMPTFAVRKTEIVTNPVNYFI